MNFFFSLEDKLIMWLTAICWWFDLRFNLKSKDLANPFMSLIGGTFYVSYTKDLLDFLYLIIICLLMSILNSRHIFGAQMYLDSEKSPNPNRYQNLWKMVQIVVMLIILLFVKDKLTTVLVTIMNFSWFYVLCTEPMPPAEKEKRKNKKSLGKLELSNQV